MNASSIAWARIATSRSCSERRGRQPRMLGRAIVPKRVYAAPAGHRRASDHVVHDDHCKTAEKFAGGASIGRRSRETSQTLRGQQRHVARGSRYRELRASLRGAACRTLGVLERLLGAHVNQLKALAISNTFGRPVRHHAAAHGLSSAGAAPPAGGKLPLVADNAMRCATRRSGAAHCPAAKPEENR
jgi:hypothetical protein